MTRFQDMNKKISESPNDAHEDDLNEAYKVGDKIKYMCPRTKRKKTGKVSSVEQKSGDTVYTLDNGRMVYHSDLDEVHKFNDKNTDKALQEAMKVKRKLEAFDPDDFAKNVGAKSYKPSQEDKEARRRILKNLDDPKNAFPGSRNKKPVSGRELINLDKLLRIPFDKDFRHSDDKNVFRKNQDISKQVHSFVSRMSDEQFSMYKDKLKKAGYSN